MTIRVPLAHDQAVLRQTFRIRISATPAMEVVGEAHTRLGPELAELNTPRAAMATRWSWPRWTGLRRSAGGAPPTCAPSSPQGQGQLIPGRQGTGRERGRGLAGNEDTLRMFVRCSFEQGLISREHEPAGLFAPETREAYVI